MVTHVATLDVPRHVVRRMARAALVLNGMEVTADEKTSVTAPVAVDN